MMLDSLPPLCRDHLKLIAAIIADLARSDVDAIAKRGQLDEGVHPEDIARRLREYPATILPIGIPEILRVSCAFKVPGESERVDVDTPLVTREEGRSDLTLQTICRVTEGRPSVVLYSVHVM